MKVIEVPLQDLKEAEYNPRQMTEKQVKDLTESIKQFGLVDPIIVNNHKGRKNVVVGGHQRLKIASILGLKTIPVVYVNLDEKRERELNLRLNRNLGEWDYNLLANFNEKELLNVGFTSEELDKMFNLEEDEFDADKEYDQIVEPQTKEGDLYQLGNHRLLCGDSTKEESFKKLMGNEKAQLVFADPPYNVGYDYWGFRGTRKHGVKSKKTFNDKKTPEQYRDFINKVFKECFSFSKESSSIYCWHASKMEYPVRLGLENSGWHISQTILWLKNQLTPSPGQDYNRIYEPCYFGWKLKEKHFINKRFTGKWDEKIILDRNDFKELLDIMYERKDLIKNYQHPTQKPVRLAERAIKKHSNRDDIVLEPFNGSGSTMMACEQLERKCYAIELDPKFVDVAIKRWEQYTNNKAVKI